MKPTTEQAKVETLKRKLKQLVCGRIFPHNFYNCDRGGFVGSNLADCWCNYCGKMVTMPREETR